MLTKAEAREQVKTNVAADLDPTLTDAEIDAILAETARGTAWAAGTALAWGAFVLPTARTGHVYRVTSAGTTGATEPAWPISSFSTTSSGTAVLQEAGPDTGELYDVRRATYAAYRLKLSKAQNYLTVSGDGQTVNLQQIVANLEANLRRWTPVEIS